MNRRCRVAASIALATAELSAGASCSPGPAPATIVHHGDEPRTMDHGALAAQGWVVDTLPATTTTATIPPTTATTEEPTTTTTEPEPVVTTPVTTPVTTRRSTTTTTVYEPPSPQSRTTGRGNEPPAGDTPPEYIKQCESGGDYRAVNPRSGAGGAWQFLPSTWRAVGGTGLPQDASPAEQDYRAALLWDGGRGAHHWVCS